MKTLKHGFTLIELLIVITIIAILSGAALPYVQQYVDDARQAKAKQDLDEIRNALVRFETDQNRPYTATDTAMLVGPYLSKGMVDPWGSPYRIAPASSACYSVGEDGLDGSGDEIKQFFRPPLALSRAYWEDTNSDSRVSTGDNLILKFTRPIAAAGGPVLADLSYSAGTPANVYSAKALSDNDMTVKLTLDFGAALPFAPGKDTIQVVPSSSILDGDSVPCKPDQPTVIKARN